ncbi:MAG: transcriptional repressor [Chloroflexi bacterium]|nr:transcriptional repressor [Chloroflexota bacterium]
MSHNQTEFARLARAQGFRVTPQRQMILDSVCEGGGHCTPEDIYERVRRRAPAVNRATVYRTLEFLCDLRLVVAIQIGRQMLYEVAGEQAHHHLVCRNCNRLQDLDCEAVAALCERVTRERGFVVDMEHLALTGLCRTCREAGELAQPGSDVTGGRDNVHEN